MRLPPVAAGRVRSLALVAMLVLPVALTGCGTIAMTEPAATPTGFPGLVGRLHAVQITVDDYVSGDAGCMDPDLVPAAISFHASGLDQATRVKLYLYVFRNRDAFGRHLAQVGPCAQAWVTDAQTYEEIDQSPYVLAGQGPWAPGFKAAMRTVLLQAAGTGG